MLAALLAALILAGCEGGPIPPPPVEQPSDLGAIRGIDLPTDASDVLNELRGNRLDFVARYYRDPASRWPTLSVGEVHRLSSLGLKIVTVWEWHSGTPAYFSYASGYYDGVSAYRQAYSVGQPADSAIYFAVDFNAGGYQLWQVDQYFRGVAAAFAAVSRGRPGYKVGVYGSGAVCDAVKRAGLARYSWLSSAKAWAGYETYADWNIRQGDRLPNLSFDHDSDEATDDYGGFSLANYAIAAPMVSAAPRPAQPSPRPRPSFLGGISSLY
jgi:hypothetical protein